MKQASLCSSTDHGGGKRRGATHVWRVGASELTRPYVERLQQGVAHATYVLNLVAWSGDAVPDQVDRRGSVGHRYDVRDCVRVSPISPGSDESPIIHTVQLTLATVSGPFRKQVEVYAIAAAACHARPWHRQLPRRNPPTPAISYSLR